MFERIGGGTPLPPSSNSRLYLPGETLYAAVALRALELGWTLIPQERGERRISSRVDGRALRWGKYVSTPPTAGEVKHWSNQVPGANGAILLGEPSGLVFCFDIDVTDQALSEAVQQRIEAALGPTRFARQGAAPKMALFYRVETVEELPPNRAYRFVDDDGVSPTDHLLEIQARGKLVTAFGYHHKTDKYFQWEGPQPSTHRTDAVPLVTLEQIEMAIESVQDIRAFHRNAPRGAAAIESFETAPDGSIRRPKLKLSDWAQPWTEDPTTGLVVDGREAYLWDLASVTVRSNPDFAAAADGVGMLRADVSEQFRQTAAMTGKWTEHYLRNAVLDKVGRAVRDLREGRTKPIGAAAHRLPNTVVPKSGHKFLMLTDRRIELPAQFEAIDEEECAQRALNTDRDAASKTIAHELREAILASLEAVYEGRTEEVHSIKGATGSGKTSQMIQIIADDPRTYCDDHLPLDSDERMGPFVFMLPTYNNVSELKQRADILGIDPSLSDAEIMAEAAMLGIHPHDKTLTDIRQGAKGSRLKTMVYEGKRKAGCQMHGVLEMLQGAGIRTGQLCKSKDKDAYGQVVEKHCAFYESCPAILQRIRIPEHHVVFVVQNFLTLNVPEELSKARAVILDERVFHLVVKNTTMSIKALERGRSEPRLSKKEREAGLDPKDLIQDREEAAAIAIDVLKSGHDLATVFRQHERGRDIVGSAKRVCGSSMNVDQAVFPNMTLEQVEGILASPKGVEIGEEYRFWSLIAERMDSVELDEQMSKVMTRSEAIAAGSLGAVLEATKNEIETPRVMRAPNDYDPRIHYLPAKERVSLSWMLDMNWSDVPRILLDASMDPIITDRLFPGTNVIDHPITTDLNLRVLFACDMNWSISSVTPQKDDSPAQLSGKATLIHQIRQHIAKTAAIYAHGCVIYVMPKKLRAVVQRDLVVPFNVDIRHHGAVKGLDFAKEHVAVVSLGRLEPPTDAIDGQVAALTARDHEPENRIDPTGSGQDAEGNQIYQSREMKKVKLRDQNAFIQSQEYSGVLARALQKQYREEEVRQIIGRPRPIHRRYTADAIIIGQSLPDDIIVDQVTTFGAMMADADFWDLVRRCGGIIDVEAISKRSPIPMTAAEAQARMDRIHGIDEILARYHCIMSKTADGRVVKWYVPGYFSDDEAVVRAYAQECAPQDEIISIRMSEMTVMPYGRAPEDDIDRMYGDAREQFVAEAGALRPVIELLMRRGKLAKSLSGYYRAGTGEAETLRLPLEAWPVLNSWLDQRKAAEQEITGAMPAPLEIEEVAEEAPVMPVISAPPDWAPFAVMATGETAEDWDDLMFG